MHSSLLCCTHAWRFLPLNHVSSPSCVNTPNFALQHHAEYTNVLEASRYLLCFFNERILTREQTIFSTLFQIENSQIQVRFFAFWNMRIPIFFVRIQLRTNNFSIYELQFGKWMQTVYFFMHKGCFDSSTTDVSFFLPFLSYKVFLFSDSKVRDLMII